MASVSATSAAVPPPASFAAPPIYSVGGSAVGLTGLFSMAKGDFNGDGVSDFATVGFACANGEGLPADAAAVYLGVGDGTFRPPAYYPAGGCPYHIVVGRLRGTNAPEDLIIVNERFDENGITVLLGNGDGTFQSAVTMPLPSTPTASAIGDFNGDGKADIGVALFGGSGQDGGNLQSLAVLLGHGDGTFDAPVLYQSLNNPYGIAVGDFNNDGKSDIVIRNPEALALSLGNGDGTFLPGYVILAEPSTLVSVNPPGPILNGLVAFTTGDFNGDGSLDIAAAEDGERIDVLLGTGTGAFQPPVTYLNNQHQTGSGGGQIAAARLTNDGPIDLVVNTGYGTTLAVFRGNGDGTFQSPVVYPLPQYDDEGLVIADVNSDGSPDIITGTQGGRGGNPNFLTVLLNKGAGDFGPPPPLFSVKSPANQGTATNAVGVTLADLTGNGNLDLVVTDWDVPIEPLANGQLPPLPTVNFSTQQIDTHGTISVLAGNGDGTFQTEQQYYVGGRPIAVAIGDLTGDGKKDAVVVNAFDNTVSILKGNGDHTFQSAITIQVGTNPNALVLGDFNGDGKLDIALTNLVDNNVSILINQSTPGTLNFQTPVNYAVGTYPSGVITGDFNHDGKLDLAIVCSGYFFSSDPDGKHTALSILLGNGDGTFGAAATQRLWEGDGGDAIAAADFGRGEEDLAVANFSTGEVMILQGHGDGTFMQAGLYRVGSGPEGMVAVDFNRDGRIDIAVNDLNDNTVALLLGNGDATFVPPATRTDDGARLFGLATWGYPAFIAAGDLNRDGKPDVVVSNLFEAAVTVLRNTTIPPVPLTSVVSRKIHGSAGTFEIDLSLAENPGIECRSGSNGNHTIVFNFANPLSNVAGASVTSGTGTISSSAIGSDPRQYVVSLTGVTNAQVITVSLTNVYDSVGNYSSSVSASMGLLLGDTTANGAVSNTDVAAVKGQVAAPVTASNFRDDVNANGVISNTDVSAVKGQVGTSLP